MGIGPVSIYHAASPGNIEGFRYIASGKDIGDVGLEKLVDGDSPVNFYAAILHQVDIGNHPGSHNDNPAFQCLTVIQNQSPHLSIAPRDLGHGATG